ncbi:hypothetical protein KCU81_g394, partial [Aureobasidium melanogenum]
MMRMSCDQMYIRQTQWPQLYNKPSPSPRNCNRYLFTTSEPDQEDSPCASILAPSQKKMRIAKKQKTRCLPEKTSLCKLFKPQSQTHFPTKSPLLLHNHQ